MKRFMITFPFPNIYLSFGYICYCFFFLVFDIMRKINNYSDAVY